ncbi:Intraflagellar transport protein 22 [Cichlidogyrus casuarinus]|uniref:Intraflagellar transport protein 22 n=1 Tax=Cichlidogyrus casuarinus TaxID=1844966 RepID=A0ABD2Q8X7_9PLAT
MIKILEYELELNNGHKSSKVDVELWDVAGDRKMIPLIPVLSRKISGAIFVYNPDKASHSKQLESWYDALKSSSALKDSQLLVLCHKTLDCPDRELVELCKQFFSWISIIMIHLADKFAKIRKIHTDFESNLEKLKKSFARFVEILIERLKEDEDREELRILNGK